MHPNKDFMPSSEKISSVQEVLEGAYLDALKDRSAITVDYDGVKRYLATVPRFTVVFGFIFHVQFQFFQLDNFLLHRNNRFCNAAAIEGYEFRAGSS